MSLLVVNKKDVVREAIETPHYFEIQGMLCGLEIKGLIDDEGKFAASVLKQVAKGHDCYETVVDILTKLGVRGDMRNWIDHAAISVQVVGWKSTTQPRRTGSVQGVVSKIRAMGKCPIAAIWNPCLTTIWL